MVVGKQDELTIGTLDGLELRLRRLEGLVTGRAPYDDHDDESPLPASSAGKSPSVIERISKLEGALEHLARTSRPVADLLSLYREHPDLFPPNTALPPSSSFNTREKLAAVNASAPSFNSTASQLVSIKDSPIPPATDSAALVALQPRLAAAERKQAAQAKEMARLRISSALLLQRWYDVGVIATEECLAEWEDRLMDAEKAVRQAEVKREGEKGPV